MSGNETINISVTLEGGYEAISWTRSITQYETILDGSGNQTVWGDWDGSDLRSAAVISTGTGFEMWYEGRDFRVGAQLGRATSSDGVTWTKDAGNPLFGSGAPGAWDEGSVREPFVLFDGGTYEMWYTAFSRRPTRYAASTNLEAGPQGGAHPSATGYATSTNGVTWTRHPDPVLEGGAEGEWDGGNESGIFDPYIVETGGTYTMWYGAWTDITGQIGCATSPDGANWTKCATNPVFGPGDPDARHKKGPNDWDQTGVKSPVVLFHDGIYHMWYGGTGDPFPDWTWHIGYVTSTNGITWTRFLTAPVLSGTGGEWDEGSIAPGSVFFDGETYHMWYGANGQIGYAWSSDGVSWTKSPNSPVLTPGTPGQWGDPVVRFEGGSDGAVLDGFTITGGDAATGGGVLIANGGSAVIANTIITANHAMNEGGGVWLTNADVTIRDSVIAGNQTTGWGRAGIEVNSYYGPAHLTLESSTVSHNVGPGGGGGGMRVWNASVEVRDATFAGNTAGGGGGGIRLDYGASAIIEDTHVVSNTASDDGGGIFVHSSASATISRTTIEGNSADSEGGGVWSGASLTITDSRIINNEANQGASGVRVGEGQLTMVNTIVADNRGVEGLHLNGSADLMNVTVVNNAAGTGRPGINFNPQTGGNLVVVNSIVYGNGTGDAFHVPDPGTIQASYSDIQGGWSGTGNIDADPFFVDPANGDYHLQPWSPCIDAGTANGAPDHDIDGNPRPRNDGYDMGADEFVGTPVPNEGPRYVATTGSDDANLCLDPAAPCQTGGHGLDVANAGESILVAQGTYTENLSISKPVTLTGGYESISWTRSITQYETIIDGSGSPTVPGDWDSDGLGAPRVISDSGQYRMWYNGQNLTYPNWGRTLGLAESPDGLNWTKCGDNPILEPGDEGEWDSMYRGQVAMMKDGGLYKMWYSGSDGGPWQTGYATSTNGIAWNIYTGNPVLPVGGGGSWDEQEANGPTVIKDGGLYQMWYHGCNPDYTICSIGYATSTSGLDWSKHAGNPVLTGTEGEWDEGTALWPSVVKDGSTYKMWYYGGGGKIGLATSPDGVNWTKHAGNPVLTEGWDGVGVHGHMVMLEGGTYRMWFRSGADNNIGIGFAESTDGISWTLSISNPVLTPGTPGQWGDPVVRFEEGSDGAVLDGFTVTGGNAEAGGGVDASGASITIRNCLIRDNFANGMPYHYGGGGVSGGPLGLTILDSRIINNQVNGGAGGVRGDSVVMVNTLVADNHGDAGIHVNGSLALMNTTVANNDGGVLFNPQASATLLITNSIIYDNGWSISDYDTGTAQVTYSDVEGGWTGTGNLDADPLFVDAANSDYHLQPDSPCVDTGTNTGAPDHDFEGDARPFAYGVDMGADEWWPMLSVTLSTDQAGEGPPGTDVTYVFTVTNNGDYTDTFSLEISGVWTPTLDVGITSPLASGGSSAVVLTVTIPPDAVNGASDVATLAATSGWSTAVSDSALATTTARWHKVYLPITLRNFGP